MVANIFNGQHLSREAEHGLIGINSVTDTCSSSLKWDYRSAICNYNIS